MWFHQWAEVPLSTQKRNLWYAWFSLLFSNIDKCPASCWYHPNWVCRIKKTRSQPHSPYVLPGLKVSPSKALKQYNWDCKKNLSSIATHYTTFSRLQRFSQQFYIWTTILIIVSENLLQNVTNIANWKIERLPPHRCTWHHLAQTSCSCFASPIYLKLWHVTMCVSLILHLTIS